MLGTHSLDNQEGSIQRRQRTSEGIRYHVCGCGKEYLSYPALYTHVKIKHGGQFPPGSITRKKLWQGEEKDSRKDSQVDASLSPRALSTNNSAPSPLTADRADLMVELKDYLPKTLRDCEKNDIFLPKDIVTAFPTRLFASEQEYLPLLQSLIELSKKPLPPKGKKEPPFSHSLKGSKHLQFNLGVSEEFFWRVGGQLDIENGISFSDILAQFILCLGLFLAKSQHLIFLEEVIMLCNMLRQYGDEFVLSEDDKKSKPSLSRSGSFETLRKRAPKTKPNQKTSKQNSNPAHLKALLDNIPRFSNSFVTDIFPLYFLNLMNPGTSTSKHFKTKPQKPSKTEKEKSRDQTSSLAQIPQANSLSPKIENLKYLGNNSPDSLFNLIMLVKIFYNWMKGKGYTTTRLDINTEK